MREEDISTKKKIINITQNTVQEILLLAASIRQQNSWKSPNF